jgi:hypothetical protein
MLANLLGGLGGESGAMSGGWRRRHVKVCRLGSRRCYNDNCVRKSSRTYKTTTGRKCRVGSHKCRDNRCHKMKMHYSRRLRT